MSQESADRRRRDRRLSQAPSDQIVQMFHVSKRYTRDSLALEDVSLTLDKGDFVFLAGPSGAEKPTQGQIIVAGLNVHRIQRESIPFLRRNIGVVFQDFKLLNRRSVFDNVAFALEVLGRPRREIKRRVTTVLRQVGLGDKLLHSPQRLSGGEQQRVAIARALVNEPALLLADEPTGNLDPKLTIDIMDLLCEANVRGTTIVVATHDPTVLDRYRKRVVTLERGRLIDDA